MRRWLLRSLWVAPRLGASFDGGGAQFSIEFIAIRQHLKCPACRKRFGSRGNQVKPVTLESVCTDVTQVGNRLRLLSRRHDKTLCLQLCKQPLRGLSGFGEGNLGHEMP